MSLTCPSQLSTSLWAFMLMWDVHPTVAVCTVNPHLQTLYPLLAHLTFWTSAVITDCRPLALHMSSRTLMWTKGRWMRSSKLCWMG